ncbi:MAG: CHAP domain-containing protein [Clostridia bacterium]|nr:CHAP domain-containing protein [Clostridia bacterium]
MKRFFALFPATVLMTGILFVPVLGTAETPETTVACETEPALREATGDGETRETGGKWTADFAHIALTGNYADDALAIAETQLGYTESKGNYVVGEDGKKKGYTRYGAWYGVPYGDWCAMFCSFCLSFADARSVGYPIGSGCATWIERLKAAGWYREADAYEPKPGDLVFFKRSHVGFFIASDGNKVTVLNGNIGGKVRYSEFDLHSIKGYAVVPSSEEEAAGITAGPVVDDAGTLLAEEIDIPGTAETATEPLAFRIVFEKNGADVRGRMNPQHGRLSSGARLKTNVYSRNGYVFTGWNTAPDGTGRAVADREALAKLIASDGTELTLYAQWETRVYRVSYFSIRAAGMPEQQTKVHGVPLRLSEAVPERTGYAFAGWALSANDAVNGRVAYPAGGTYEEDRVRTLFAVWTPATCKIVFRGNGADKGSETELRMSFGREFTMADRIFSKEGYILKGWSATPPGPETAVSCDFPVGKRLSKSESALFFAGNGYAGEKVLYAVWQPAAYAVNYRCVPESAAKGVVNPNGSTALPDTDFVPAALSSAGYDFLGFFRDSACTRPLERIAAGNTVPVTVWCKFRSHEYTVRFDAGDGQWKSPMAEIKCTYGKSYRLPEPALNAPKGYSFDRWSAESGDVGRISGNRAVFENLTATDDGTVTLTAVYACSLRVHANGGSFAGAGDAVRIKADFGEVTALATVSGIQPRKGYVLSGWSTKADGSGSVYPPDAVLNGVSEGNSNVHDLYAVWTPAG